jgi:hypothetical protein
MKYEPKPGEIDMRVFLENQYKFDRAQLWPYAGRHIAWSADGTHVVFDAADYEEWFDKLEALGIDSRLVVHDYVDQPGEAQL